MPFFSFECNRFIEFGRGKAIPLTPDSSGADVPGEISNTGKIVVKKRIAKIEKTDSMQIYDGDINGMATFKVTQRKKKGRLYSLGGNDPPKRAHRGRLDRLKTVGTFDLGNEVNVLNEVAKNLNEKILSGDIDSSGNARRSSVTAMIAMSSQALLEQHQAHQHRSAGPCRREISKLNFAQKRSASRDTKFPSSSVTSTPAGQRNVGGPNMPTQHSADDCLEKPRPLIENRKSRSCSTSTILVKSDCEIKQIRPQTASDKIFVAKKGKSSHSPSKMSTISSTHHSLSKELDGLKGGEFEANVPDGGSKCIERAAESSKTASNGELQFKPRKPVLRKSKRIVRTDSELFDEAHLASSGETGLKQTTHVQIHNEPDYLIKCGDANSRKASSDLDDVCSQHEPLKSTTEESSRNISIEEVDTVFSDSTTDLEQLEREYRELARSTLQREYKSDGDTLDEVGKRRNDFQKWKNQSFEMNLELYEIRKPSSSSAVSQSAAHLEEADRLETAESGMSVDDIVGHNLLDIDPLNLYSPTSHMTCSTNNSSEASGGGSNQRNEDRNFFSRIGASSKENLCKSNSLYAESDTSTVTSPLRVASVSTCSDPQPLSSITGGTSAVPTQRPSKLEIVQTDTISTPPPAKEGTFTSLFEKRFGKFKKINKLIRTKRFSASALYDEKKQEKRKEERAMQPEGPLPSVKSGSTSKLFRQKCSPVKSNTCGSKSSIYSSKLSLFSTKNAKASILHRNSTMFSNSSHSNNELHRRSSSKTKLSEVSKSNSEISKYKFSPSRFSIKRSMKEKKPNSTTSLYKQQVHSPLSEEFYNKTGSVRLSAVELFEKFCSHDFSGLYKHELSQLDERPNCSKKYAMNKNARLLKQKSEPKFRFRGDYDPREEDEDFYEEDYYDENETEDLEYEDELGEEEPDECDYFENEEDCEECCGEGLEDEEMDDENESHAEYYDNTFQSPVPINMYTASALLDLNYCERIQCHRLSEMLEEADEESNMNEEYEQRAYHSETEVEARQANAAAATDSEVDEIFLMPEGAKCSDYEEYGFENKHFSLEQKRISRMKSVECDLNMISEIPPCGVMPQSNPNPTSGSIYDSCGNEVAIALQNISPSGNGTETRNTEEQAISEDSWLNESTPFGTAKLDCSSVEYALSQYVKNALPDISVGIESGNEAKTEAGAVFERAESIELLSGSSGTIRSGSTLTGYDFDTVKNLNLDSCSTSKLSLSLKSDGFEEFTLTPDEPRRIKNCEAEDFTLTPDVSFTEPVTENIDEATATDNYATEDMQSKSIFDQTTKPDDGSISSAEVLIIVDKFLANERQLHHNLNIVPIPTARMTSTAVVSPVESEASSTEQRIGVLFRMNNSSSKSTIDDSVDLEKLNLDEDIDAEMSKTKESEISIFTSEITKEFDLLFTRAQHDNYCLEDTDWRSKKQDSIDNDANEFGKNKYDNTQSEGQSPPPVRLPTRYSMQKLEPYIFTDDVTSSDSSVNFDNKNLIQAGEAIIASLGGNARATEQSKTDYCKVLDIQKRIKSKLNKNRSQSLGNLNKKTRCFPL